jgi:hypothetical protein
MNSIIIGEERRIISADTGLSQEFRYTTDTYLPEDELGPWHWPIKVCDQSVCEDSGSREFWVRSATITPRWNSGYIYRTLDKTRQIT